MRVVGCTRVKNGGRYITRWIEDMSRFCDFLCVLDDGSEDNTPSLLEAAAKRHGNLFLHRQRGLPRDGGRDCNILYEMAGAMKADWIFAPDADEFVDPEDFDQIKPLVETDRQDTLAWTFPFFYLWDDEAHYRADGDYASCHVIRLFRYDPKLTPPRRVSHSQLCPDGLDRRRVRVADARMVHYGYMDRADRMAKHKFYTDRDKDPIKAGAGVKNYDHILAERDALIKPYPSGREWRDLAGRSFPGDVSRKPRRLHLGKESFPGSSAYHLDEGAVLDEVIVDGMMSAPRGFAEFFDALKPGGRIDVGTLDFHGWIKKFREAAEAEDEARQEDLLKDLAGRSPYWEQRLLRALAAVGFGRVERLPTDDGLHMIAFKPNENKKD